MQMPSPAEMKRAIVPFNLSGKSVNKDGTFTGLASTFGNVDFGGDRVVAGAFTETLAEWAKEGQLPLMPWFHDMRVLVGDWLSMIETQAGLSVGGSVWQSNKVTNESQMVFNLLDGTGPKALSIGFTIMDSKDIVENGVRIRDLIKVWLWEVSVVPFGMNPEALIDDAKFLNAKGEPDIRAIEADLMAGGLSATCAKSLLSGGFKNIARDADDSERDAGVKSILDGLNRRKNLTTGV